MKCPKCGGEMRIEDKDSEFVKYKGKKVLVRKRAWTICDFCEIHGYYDTELSYTDNEGEELDFEDDEEDTWY